ncbi:MAG: glycosyltransferase [Pseudomonadota bacterium]
MKARRRILHIVDSLERGGLERVVTDLAIAQREAGDDVGVFCLYREGALAAELRSAGIEVACANKSDGIDPRPLWRLRRAAMQGGWNVLHSHNLVPNYYTALATLAGRSRAVLINSCHDMGTRLGNNRLRRLYLWSLSRTARVAMVADQVMERYVSSGYIPASRASVVYNGIQVARFAPTLARSKAARMTLNIPADALVIGCVGRLVPVKNHALVIAALPDLLRTYPGLQLVLLGGGELKSQLQKQAEALGVSAQILFAGERADVVDLLPALDVFILPSLSEGLSIALLEAACSALAIVATNVGGNPHAIAHERNGLLIPSQDGAALTTAIRRLLGDAGLRASLGIAARDWVQQHASIEAQRQAFDKLYGAALSEAKLL